MPLGGAGIIASTRTGAELCGVDDELGTIEVGTIEVGRLADMIVVRENSCDDISHLRGIPMVMKDGIIVDTHPPTNETFSEMSNGTAWLVNRIVPDFQTFGGLILNTVYGGMNPRAVKTALRYGDGARFVSFGAHSTYFQASKEGRIVDGKFVALSELYPAFANEELSRAIRIPIDEPPTPELSEILELIAAHPRVYLNTGHISNAEAMRLIELAREYGIKKVLVASAVTKNMSVEEQRAAAANGAVIEHTLAGFTHTTPIPKTHYYAEREYAAIDEGMDEASLAGVRGMAEQIRAVGANNCIIATDFGVYTLPPPVEGMRAFIACLLDLGLTCKEIRTVTAQNPARLLGLD